MANQINEIINYGIKNKKKKEDIMTALLNANVDVASATDTLGKLDKAGLFKYESEMEQGPQVNGQQKFQEAMKFAKENMNSDDVNLKTRANKFLMDVENKKILPNGYKVERDDVAAILQNPQQWNELTASVKSELMPELAKAGFKFPRKLTGEQIKAQQNAEAALTALQDMKSEVFDEQGNIRRGNLIQEKLPFSVGARKLHSQIQSVVDPISRIRSGAALTDAEVKFYEDMVPSPQDTADDARYKMDQLDVFFSGMAGSEIKLKNDEGKIVKYDDMFDPRQRSEVRKAMQNGYRPYHGGDFDITYGETLVEGDPVQEMSRQAVATEEPQQIQGRPEKTEQKSFLTKVGEGLGDFFGGNKIGEALGGVIGNQIAKHGQAGEQFAQEIAQIEKDYQEGKYDEKTRNKMLEALENSAKEAFGYSGPSALQIAGDLGKIGMNFVGGAALKGATKASKLAGLGKLAGTGALAVVADKTADGEEVTAGDMATGAAIAGGLGVGGKALGKLGNRYKDTATDVAKAIGMTGKMGTDEALKKIPQATRGFQTILDEAKDIKVKDINGVEKVFNPNKATFGETLQALKKSKESIYSKYTQLAKDAGDGGAVFSKKDFSDVISELNNMKADTTGAFRSKINSIINDLETNFGKKVNGKIEFSDTDIERIQKFIENINVDVNPMSDKAGAQVSGSVSKMLRNILDNKISTSSGKGYQQLRNQYADLKSIENDLINQFKKSTRGLGKGVGDWVEGFGSLDTVVGLLMSNPATAVKGAGMMGLGKIMKHMRDPETKLRKVFKALQKQKKPIKKQGKIGNMLDDIDEYTDSAIKKAKGKGGMSIQNTSPKAIAEQIDNEDMDIMEAFIDKTRLRKPSKAIDADARAIAKAMGIEVKSNSRLADKFDEILSYRRARDNRLKGNIK